MLLVEFLSWWYSRGLVELAHKIGKMLRNIWRAFSIPLLLKTLFAPWKRITFDAGKSIGDHTRALGNNLLSRLVGFTVRIFAIIAGLVTILIVTLVGAVLLVVWPLMPIAIVYFIVRMVV